MIQWVVMFLILAIVNAVLSFGLIGGPLVGVSQILFFVFMALFLLGLFLERKFRKS